MSAKRSAVLPLPRFVKPEMLDIGDVIRVTYEKGEDGLKKTVEGAIHHREYRGSDRILTTAEGGVLLTWNPHHTAPRITLLAKAEPFQPMLSMFEDLKERVS